MREILFKAQRLDNGEWVEGNYVNGYTFHYILPIPMAMAQSGCAIVVNKATICQYTGLKDKNGNKIWENDIVNKVDTNGLGYHRERKCKVSFDELGYWLLTTEYGDGYWLGEFDSEQLEVIGNIFDNPELLNYVDNEASQQAHQEVLKSAT